MPLTIHVLVLCLCLSRFCESAEGNALELAADINPTIVAVKEPPSRVRTLVRLPSRILKLHFTDNDRRILIVTEKDGLFSYCFDGGLGVRQVMRFPSKLECADISRDGVQLACVHADGTVRTCNLASKRVEVLARKKYPPATRLQFSFDGRRLVVAAPVMAYSATLGAHVLCALEVWDVDAQKQTGHEWGVRGNGESLCLVPGTSEILLKRGATYGPVETYSWSGGAVLTSLAGASARGSRLACSLNGRTVASYSNEWNIGHNTLPGIELWERETGSRICELGLNQDDFSSARFSANGRFLAAGTSVGSVIIWDHPLERQLSCSKAHEGEVCELCFSSDGSLLASGGANGAVVVHDLEKISDITGRSMAGIPDCDALWNELAEANASAAFRATKALVSAPQVAIPYLRRALCTPTQAGDDAYIEKLAIRLDADSFRKREQASSELALLGSRARERLQRRLQAGGLSLEARKRSEVILTSSGPGLTSDELRRLRVIHILEMLGGKNAWDIIESVAQHEADPIVSEAAQASILRRNNRRGSRDRLKGPNP